MLPRWISRTPQPLFYRTLGFKTLIDVPSQKIHFHWNGVHQGVGAQSQFSRLTLELTEAICVQDGERVDKALIGRNLKVNDPVSLERAYNSLKRFSLKPRLRHRMA
jgi:hypothetical protein